MIKTRTTDPKNPKDNEIRKPSAFFWTMLGLCILDIFMLFLILNPVSGALKGTKRPVYATSSIAELEPITSTVQKPSPLGRVAGSRAASGKHDSLVADANRRPKLLPAVYTQPVN